MDKGRCMAIVRCPQCIRRASLPRLLRQPQSRTFSYGATRVARPRPRYKVERARVAAANRMQRNLLTQYEVEIEQKFRERAVHSARLVMSQPIGLEEDDDVHCGVFWDIENVKIQDQPPAVVIEAIRDFAGTRKIPFFQAYLTSIPLGSAYRLHSIFAQLGVTFIQCYGATGKDTADKKIISDMWRFYASFQRHSPHAKLRVILISGDRDFADVIGQMRNLGVEVGVLTGPQHTVSGLFDDYTVGMKVLPLLGVIEARTKGRDLSALRNPGNESLQPSRFMEARNVIEAAKTEDNSQNQSQRVVVTEAAETTSQSSIQPSSQPSEQFQRQLSSLSSSLPPSQQPNQSLKPQASAKADVSEIKSKGESSSESSPIPSKSSLDSKEQATPPTKSKEQKATQQKSSSEWKKQDKSYSDRFSTPSKSHMNEAIAEESNRNLESAEVVSGHKDEVRNQPNQKKSKEEKPKEMSSLDSSISKDSAKLEEEVSEKAGQPSLPVVESATSPATTSPATTPVHVPAKDAERASPPPSSPSLSSIFQRITSFLTKSEPDPPPAPKSDEIDKISPLHDTSAQIPGKPNYLSSTPVDRDNLARKQQNFKEFHERRAERRAERQAAKERRLKNSNEVPVHHAQNETAGTSLQETRQAKSFLDTSEPDKKPPSSHVTSDKSAVDASKLASAKGNDNRSPHVSAQSSEPTSESITKPTVEPSKQPSPERPNPGLFGRLFRAVTAPVPFPTASDEDAKPLKQEAEVKVDPQIKSQLSSWWARPLGLTWPDPKSERQVEEANASPVEEATINEHQSKEPTLSSPPLLRPPQRHIITAVEATVYPHPYSRILTPYIPPSESPFAKMRPEPLLPAFSAPTKNKTHSRNSSLMMALIPSPKKDTALEPIEYYAECLRGMSIRPPQLSTVDINTLWESTLGLLKFEGRGKVEDRELREWVRHTVYNMLELAGKRKEEKDRMLRETRIKRVVERELANGPAEKGGWYQLTENATSAEAKSEVPNKPVEGVEEAEGALAESATAQAEGSTSTMESAAETTSTPSVNIESVEVGSIGAADSISTETTFSESAEGAAHTQFAPDEASTTLFSEAIRETAPSESANQSLSTDAVEEPILEFASAEAFQDSVSTDTVPESELSPTAYPAYPPPYPSPSIVIPLPDDSLPKSSSEDTKNNKTWTSEQLTQREQRAS